ncbi:hypothetical protein KIL84_007061 [Mauremys mutica]|uniref:Uncharacterized protein n=1 Tax=Mauremys mutica TaxID=74926 RepID=A0A9D3X216_9SAUR|nr:hypothetical protein KIL84_007061 [Mauremys mutica]
MKPGVPVSFKNNHLGVIIRLLLTVHTDSIRSKWPSLPTASIYVVSALIETEQGLVLSLGFSWGRRKGKSPCAIPPSCPTSNRALDQKLLGTWTLLLNLLQRSRHLWCYGASVMAPKCQEPGCGQSCLVVRAQFRHQETESRNKTSVRGQMPKSCVRAGIIVREPSQGLKLESEN